MYLMGGTTRDKSCQHGPTASRSPGDRNWWSCSSPPRPGTWPATGHLALTPEGQLGKEICVPWYLDDRNWWSCPPPPRPWNLLCHRASRSDTWGPIGRGDLCPLISGDEEDLGDTIAVYILVHISSVTSMQNLYWGSGNVAILPLFLAVPIKHPNWMELATEISDHHYTTEPQHTVWVILK